MADQADPGFVHLNRDGAWPGFEWRGLETATDGALRLQSLPRLRGSLPEAVEACGDRGPAGVAVAADGTVFWSDPERGLVHRMPGCHGATPPAPDDRPPDPARGRPVALLVHEPRHALLVADQENHRLDRYALADFQWLGHWGAPGTSQGRFDTPSAMAADAAGHVYVADTGNARVQKLDRNGVPVPSFASQLAAGSALPGAPIALGVADTGEGERVWILDDTGTVVVANLDGHPQRTMPLGLAAPSALLVTDDGLLVGDGVGDAGRLIRFTTNGERVGAAHGYRGPVAGIAGWPGGRCRDKGFLVAPGCGVRPLAFDFAGAFVTEGLLWAGPVSDGDVVRAWQRLAPVGSGLDEGAVHVHWFVFATNDYAVVPPPPGAGSPGFGPPWQALAPDAPDVWIGAASRFLWIGARIEGGGLGSPAIGNLRLERDRAGYARHLPAIYQTRADDPDGLFRFLGLFESFFADQEQAIDTLEARFSPRAAPLAWLPGLAGWLGLDLDEAWPEEKQRRAIAEAWERHRWRGTARGLRAALKRYADIDALVEEPHLQASWWALPPEDADPEAAEAAASVLGFSTMLAAREPAGAVLGSSAVLEQSDLVTGDLYGSSLFEATAHRFSVRIFERQISDPEDVGRIRRVVDREKPAHTAYDVCVIGPRFRLGYQARLGVDAVIGGDRHRPTLLGVAGQQGVVLAGEPAGRLGEDSRVGQSTRLDAGVVERTNAVSEQ